MDCHSEKRSDEESPGKAMTALIKNEEVIKWR